MSVAEGCMVSLPVRSHVLSRESLCPGGLCQRGGVFVQRGDPCGLTPMKQDCIPVGCVPPACWPYLPACTAVGWGYLLLGGCLLLGHSAPSGVSAPRGVPAPGGCLPLVLGGVSQYAVRQTPSVNRMTDRCKNITLPTTLFAGSKHYLAPNVASGLWAP